MPEYIEFRTKSTWRNFWELTFLLKDVEKVRMF